MMFGIPAICLAIYKAAYKENKEMVKGIMGSGAGTSFIANITEPVEFSFMFFSYVVRDPCTFCRFSRDCLLLIQYTNWFYIRSMYC